MNKRPLLSRISFVLILLAAAAFVSGCGDSSSGRGRVVAVEQRETLTLADVEQSRLQAMDGPGLMLDRRDGVGDDLAEGGILDQIWELIKNDILNPYVKYVPTSYKITYTTTDASGKVQTVTGLLVVPSDPEGKSISVPMLSLQHPTQVERKYSPSLMNLSDNELTYQTALALAMTGYIVVAADYPGLGDNTDPHPYCLTSLAHSVVDMIRAAENSRDSWRTQSQNTAWDGRLFLMGYSEGGYATMVTAKELQQSGAFPVTAAAPLDGPYSLSDTMRGLMVGAGADFAAPYFMPYVIAGYDSVYAKRYPEFDFMSAVKTDVPGYLPPPGSNYAEELYKLLDGSYTSADIDNFMKLVQPYAGPRSILTEEFLGGLEDPAGIVVSTLRDNNGYDSWMPDIPMKMFHNSLDDLVPVGNMTNALAAFAGDPSVESETFVEYIPGMGSVHSGALVFAYIKGFLWIDGFAYPDRH